MKGLKLFSDGKLHGSRWLDLTGRTFSRLTVVKQSEKNIGKRLFWECKCSCGNPDLVSIETTALTTAHTRSCGCLVKEFCATHIVNPPTHGMSCHPIGAVWRSMVARCRNPKTEAYPNYGGRGITVCQFLASDPRHIISVIGERPEGMTIDRIDNEKHYSCGQCEDCKNRGLALNIRWLSRRGQLRNYRNNKNITVGGVTRCLKEWAEVTGINYYTLYHRTQLGWSVDDLFKPVGFKRKTAA